MRSRILAIALAAVVAGVAMASSLTIVAAAPPGPFEVDSRIPPGSAHAVVDALNRAAVETTSSTPHTTSVSSVVSTTVVTTAERARTGTRPSAVGWARAARGPGAARGRGR